MLNALIGQFKQLRSNQKLQLLTNMYMHTDVCFLNKPVATLLSCRPHLRMVRNRKS